MLLVGGFPCQGDVEGMDQPGREHRFRSSDLCWCFLGISFQWHRFIFQWCFIPLAQLGRQVEKWRGGRKACPRAQKSQKSWIWLQLTRPANDYVCLILETICGESGRADSGCLWPGMQTHGFCEWTARPKPWSHQAALTSFLSHCTKVHCANPLHLFVLTLYLCISSSLCTSEVRAPTVVCSSHFLGCERNLVKNPDPWRCIVVSAPTVVCSSHFLGCEKNLVKNPDPCCCIVVSVYLIFVCLFECLFASLLVCLLVYSILLLLVNTHGRKSLNWYTIWNIGGAIWT